MGFRFRKSWKIGPFRATLSKSGISYSVGVKGYRVTKTTSGRVRTTASIPGTGISYVKETSAKKETPIRAVFSAYSESSDYASGIRYNGPLPSSLSSCDDILQEAARIVIGCREASIPMLQRELQIGYTRAARMIDQLERFGVIGPYNGGQPREVLFSP